MRLLVHGNLLISLLVLFDPGGCRAALAETKQTPEPSTASIPPARPSLIKYEVVRTYPHDPTAFTQGLLYQQGYFLEGTGLYGQSTLRRVEVESGKVIESVWLPPNLFGEGIAAYGGRIYQLTWRAGLGLIYDQKTISLIDTFSYEGEGWGLTSDGKNLIMSDGSAAVRILEPAGFRELRRITVVDESGPVANINELEFIRGQVFANIWHQNRIVRFSLETGSVTGVLDLAELVDRVAPKDRRSVLNGIAFDPDTERLFVTGKLWPVIFELRLLEEGARDSAN